MVKEHNIKCPCHPEYEHKDAWRLQRGEIPCLCSEIMQEQIEYIHESSKDCSID